MKVNPDVTSNISEILTTIQKIKYAPSFSPIERIKLLYALLKNTVSDPQLDRKSTEYTFASLFLSQLLKLKNIDKLKLEAIYESEKKSVLTQIKNLPLFKSKL